MEKAGCQPVTGRRRPLKYITSREPCAEHCTDNLLLSEHAHKILIEQFSKCVLVNVSFLWIHQLWEAPCPVCLLRCWGYRCCQDQIHNSNPRTRHTWYKESNECVWLRSLKLHSPYRLCFILFVLIECVRRQSSSCFENVSMKVLAVFALQVG